MTGWALTEAVVGLVLVVLACYVIVRPQYRHGRVLLGMTIAAFAVVDGLGN